MEEPLLVAAQGEVVEGALSRGVGRCRGPAISAARPPSGDGRRRAGWRGSTATTARASRRWPGGWGRGSRRAGRGGRTRPDARRGARAPPDRRATGLHDRWRSRSKRSVSSTRTLVITVMPTTPTTRAMSAERSDGRSEAAGNSWRLTTRKTRTPRANSDSSTSPPRREVQDEGDRPAAPPRTTTRPALARAGCPGPGPAGRSRPGPPGLRRSGWPVGEELQHQVEAAPQGWGDGVEQVDDPGDEDGRRGPPPDPAGPAADRAEVGGRGPRRARRDRRPPPSGWVSCTLPVPRVTRRSSSVAPGELGPGEQQADVELGAGLELDPADLLAGQEDRGQAQPAAVLLDHLAGARPALAKKPGTEVGELGLEGRRR